MTTDQHQAVLDALLTISDTLRHVPMREGEYTALQRAAADLYKIVYRASQRSYQAYPWPWAKHFTTQEANP